MPPDEDEGHDALPGCAHKLPEVQLAIDAICWQHAGPTALAVARETVAARTWHPSVEKVDGSPPPFVDMKRPMG